MLGESLVQPHGHFWAKPMTYWYWKDVIPVPFRQGVAGRLLFFCSNRQTAQPWSAEKSLQVLGAFSVKVNTLTVPIFSRDNRCNANTVLTVMPAM